MEERSFSSLSSLRSVAMLRMARENGRLGDRHSLGDGLSCGAAGLPFTGRWAAPCVAGGEPRAPLIASQ